MIEPQELFCHECNNYVQFHIDMSLSGNHVLKCPKCGHEHCRVVRKGKITDDRWDSRNFTYYVVSATYSSTTTASTSDYYLRDSWGSTTAV